MTDDAVVAFYGGAPDVEGRTLDEILAWDDQQLEDVHDYIQWLFPTAKASMFNSQAPLLTPGAVAAFGQQPELRTRLLSAFLRMLRFYGFELETRPRPVVRRGPNWSERRGEWLTPGNHNLLRITRILDCLASLGLAEHARAFLDALESLDDRDKREIGPRSYQFWREAARR
jgi:hypothetical protein